MTLLLTPQIAEDSYLRLLESNLRLLLPFTRCLLRAVAAVVCCCCCCAVDPPWIAKDIMIAGCASQWPVLGLRQLSKAHGTALDMVTSSIRALAVLVG
jgi:hypothetical protein